MSVDSFTESLRILAVGLSALFIIGVVECVRHWRWQRRRRPYDYEVDGECDNRSHPRIVP